MATNQKEKRLREMYPWAVTVLEQKVSSHALAQRIYTNVSMYCFLLWDLHKTSEKQVQGIKF